VAVHPAHDCSDSNCCLARSAAGRTIRAQVANTKEAPVRRQDSVAVLRPEWCSTGYQPLVRRLTDRRPTASISGYLP
jgi:hypothetical protein